MQSAGHVSEFSMVSQTELLHNCVGEKVGLGVGLRDGTLVGLKVGWLVGLLEGDFVGFVVIASTALYLQKIHLFFDEEDNNSMNTFPKAQSPSHSPYPSSPYPW